MPLPRPPPSTRRGLIASTWGLVIAASIGGCSPKPTGATPVPAGAVVVALGDSLTYGTGAPPEASYPAVLAALTGWTVVNAGVPGDTASQGLERLPALLVEHQPALVLVSLGGNDLLRRLSEDTLRARLLTICDRVRATGAQLLLVAVPRPTLAAAFTGSLTDHPLYAKLATELKLPLASDAWSAVLADADLRSDSIHANARGYARFAHRLRDAAVANGLLARPR